MPVAAKDSPKATGRGGGGVGIGLLSMSASNLSLKFVIVVEAGVYYREARMRKQPINREGQDSRRTGKQTMRNIMINHRTRG